MTARRRRPKMRRWVLRLDERTDRRLRLRAAAHGVSMAVYVRALINGERPGAEPGSAAAQADAWWDSRSPKRRVAIYRNHVTASSRGDDSDDDQLTIFDHEDGPDE